MMYIYYIQTFLVWKTTMLTVCKRKYFVETWFKTDFLYTWLLIMYLTYWMYIFKLYVVRYQKLHYSYLRLHLYGHKHLPWGAVSFLQHKQHRPHLLYHIHTALAVLSIHSMMLGVVFSPAHFLSTTHTLCAPFPCSYHRNRCLKDGSCLCVALFAMTTAHIGLATSTSTAFAPCTPAREPLTSSLPKLHAWLFSADGITRNAPQSLGFTPG